MSINAPVRRRILFDQQNKRCFWCDRVMNRPPKGARKKGRPARSLDVTIDHIIPQSCGGTDAWGNLIGACFDCNNRRGSMDAETFGRLMWTAQAGSRYSRTGIEYDAPIANPGV